MHYQRFAYKNKQVLSNDWAAGGWLRAGGGGGADGPAILSEREKNKPRKMVKNVRVTYRRRHSYATKSNGIVAVKTPGTCRSFFERRAPL